MLRGLPNVGGGVPVGTEARAGLSDTADTNTNINPTTSGAILRNSRKRVIAPPPERVRSTKSTTRKHASRALVIHGRRLTGYNRGTCTPAAEPCLFIGIDISSTCPEPRPR